MTVVLDNEVDAAAARAAAVARPNIWVRLLRHNSVLIGGATMLIMILIGICAPFLGTISPERIDPTTRNKRPGVEITVRQDDGSTVQRTVLMGTDSLGRDIYSRVMYGTRVSLIVGFSVAALSIAIGVLLSAIAIVLAIEMKGLLIGEGASPERLEVIADEIAAAPSVTRLIHMRTEHLGPDELLLAAKVEFAGHLDVAGLAAAIDEVERRVRSAVPEARLIYLEPDIARADAAT